MSAAVAPPTSCDPFQVSDEVHLTCPLAGYEGPGWTLKTNYVVLLNFTPPAVYKLSNR